MGDEEDDPDHHRQSLSRLPADASGRAAAGGSAVRAAVSVSEAATALGVSRQSLHAILAERAAVSPEMAVRLGKLLGNRTDLWLRMQTARDLWDAKRAMAEIVDDPDVAGSLTAHIASGRRLTHQL